MFKYIANYSARDHCSTEGNEHRKTREDLGVREEIQLQCTEVSVLINRSNDITAQCTAELLSPNISVSQCLSGLTRFPDEQIRYITEYIIVVGKVRSYEVTSEVSGLSGSGLTVSRLSGFLLMRFPDYRDAD